MSADLEKVLAGLDASRRVAWRKFYELQERMGGDAGIDQMLAIVDAAYDLTGWFPDLIEAVTDRPELFRPEYGYPEKIAESLRALNRACHAQAHR